MTIASVLFCGFWVFVVDCAGLGLGFMVTGFVVLGVRVWFMTGRVWVRCWLLGSGSGSFEVGLILATGSGSFDVRFEVGLGLVLATVWLVLGWAGRCWFWV